MQDTKKNPVEEALIQMKNVEEAIAENAKGILASTMKEEINQLVKESLSEQDDEDEIELDTDVDIDTDDAMADKMDMDTDVDNMDDVDMEIDTDSETPIDLTDASDEEILRVFKAMGEEDGIIVKKDGDYTHLMDNNADVEYLVKLGESEEDKNLEETMEFDEFEQDSDGTVDDASTEDVINAIFGGSSMEESDDMDEEGVMYEIEFNEDDDDDEFEDDTMVVDEDDIMVEDDDDDDDDEFEDDTMNLDGIDESYNPKRVKKSETKESKISTKKPKGVGIGSGPKFSYKSSGKGGFKEDKKEGPKTMGTGKAKFDYKKGENMEGSSKVVKKAEPNEAARTLGMGSNFRKGGLPKPRAHSKFNSAIKNESLESEVKMLREKNEEYRKALNIFREKLTEVAIFNSNLAYATRLFTEHSTTKKEKINILRRFDDVETIKESKNLYKSVKDELTKTSGKSINESVEKKINNTVSSGSATTLIESKTYENPQFLRMKDLMSKLR
jgi:hypothetical protein